MTNLIPHLETAEVPEIVSRNLAWATVRAMRRMQEERPDLWAKMKARAEELRKQNEAMKKLPG